MLMLTTGQWMTFDREQFAQRRVDIPDFLAATLAIYSVLREGR